MNDAGARPGRIVVLAPNWLGDVVMAAPLLSLLRQREETAGAEIVLGVRRRWAPLFAEDPRVDRLWPLERTGRHAGTAGLWRQARELAGLSADAVLIGPPSLRAGLVAALAGAKVRVGYRGDGRDWLLNRPLDRLPRGAAHYTQEMLALGYALFGEDPGKAAAGVGREAADYLPGCARWPAWSESGVADGPPLWALAPGTTFGPAKTWPARRQAEFLERAVDGEGRRVVLLGDEGSADLCNELRESSGLPWRTEPGGPAGVIDLIGRTDLRRVVAVLRAVEAFVGNDSGLMHLAGALGVPTVGLFGSSNPDWTAPGGPRIRTIAAAGYPCRPCYRPTCNQPRFCMEDIGPDQVLGAVGELLVRGREEGSR